LFAVDVSVCIIVGVGSADCDVDVAVVVVDMIDGGIDSVARVVDIIGS